MRTTTSASTRSTPLVGSRLATPPPSPTFDLHDADLVVGWLDDRTIGFTGFGDETEAAHAAWVAYRTMLRRFDRERGRRPIPIDTESIALGRRGDVERIFAGGRPIATLVRPAAGSPSGRESFGFELRVPEPADELTMRSTAHLLYRTLRRSGIRWALWAPEPGVATAAPEARAEESATATPAHGRRDRAALVIGPALVALALLAVVGLPEITTSAVGYVLGGATALLVLVALASRVRALPRWGARSQ